MTKLSFNERQKFISDARNHMSLTELSKKYNISRGRAQQIKKEEDLKEKSMSNGRPRILDDRYERLMMRKLVSGEASTATEVVEMYPDLNISPVTVRRCLHRQGLTTQKKIKKPLLTMKHKRDHLDFAYAHQDWQIEDWRRVIFSDESKINRHWSDGNK